MYQTQLLSIRKIGTNCQQVSVVCDVHGIYFLPRFLPPKINLFLFNLKKKQQEDEIG